MRPPATRTALLSLALVACGSDAPTAPVPKEAAPVELATAPPEVIALPNGFWPEGIDFGHGSTFYVGSLATGAIWRGDARTGTGDLLVAGTPGREAVGLKHDARHDRLFVAGGFTGQAYVYDVATGAMLALYQLTAPGGELINDVALTRDAAYFTNSSRPVIYRMPLALDGALPAADAVVAIPLTGDFAFVEGAFNANGIAATPNEQQLILVNSTTGLLYRVDAATGEALEIDLDGGLLLGGDGILLVGTTAYVVQGDQNVIAVVRLRPDFSSGVIAELISDPDLRSPSTIARHGNALYAVNARFDVPVGPEVEYEVVRVPR